MGLPKQQSKLPPYRLVKLIGVIRSVLLLINRKIYPGRVVLYEQIQNLWVLSALYVAAELDIAEHLRESAKSIEVLASETNSHPESLYRVMRALSDQGIFKEKKNRCFALTSMSKALLNENASLRYFILHHLGKVNWNSLGNLIHSVRTGEDAITKLYGEPIYEYLKHHPDESELFDKSMSNLSDISLDPVLQAYNFSKVNTIADIGGGEGLLLASILSNNKHLKGILFDLPNEVQKSKEIFDGFGVSDRVTIVTGDFFESIPFPADVYILKNITHNWNDEKCIHILKKINESMPFGGKILIVEMVILGNGFNPIPKILDIQMLAAVSGGKERTKEEFYELITRSGLRLKRFIPTIAPLVIIEVVKK